MPYRVVLKSLKDSAENITLSTAINETIARQYHKSWRRLLGGKHWTIDRRPGADTLDHLMLTVEKIP